MSWDKNELWLILWRAISVLFSFDHARKQPRGTDCLPDYFLRLDDFLTFGFTVGQRWMKFDLPCVWLASAVATDVSRHFIGTVHDAEALKHQIVSLKVGHKKFGDKKNQLVR